MAVYMAKYTWRKIRNPKTFLCRHMGEERIQISNCQLCWRHILCSDQKFLFSFNSPFPWRMQSIFNDFIDLTIGLQCTLFTAEMFRSCQHLMRINLLFGITLIDCKTAYICRKICFAMVCLCADAVWLPPPPPQNHHMSYFSWEIDTCRAVIIVYVLLKQLKTKCGFYGWGVTKIGLIFIIQVSYLMLYFFSLWC